ncbi:MAG: NYN domain-containing protein [Oligoflexia bacterium]|nr:NYN domain-containing protein [Oligoflexia bacterium]
MANNNIISSNNTNLTENTNIALYCDFENIALGVRDAKYKTFDITKVLERILLKGSIVVKKAYCDWDRYKEFKNIMHEAAFELIEIPHMRQSGKNSADIRMVVDALDLCYTKSHVDTFVIISGDSDFSPLVSKLRENNKVVIGIGVKDSTSNLLRGNCDEFIFYDDLVREQKIKRKAVPVSKKSSTSTSTKDTTAHAKRQEALDLIVETLQGLVEERGDEDKIWGSLVKQTMKRRHPGFNEASYGYRSFRALVEDAQKLGLLIMNREEKTGQYTIRLIADSESDTTATDATDDNDETTTE